MVSKKTSTAPAALKILVKCGWSGARIPVPSTITTASTLADVISSIASSLPPVITKPLGSWDEPQPCIVHLHTNVLRRDWEVTKVSDFCDGGSILLTLNLPTENQQSDLNSRSGMADPVPVARSAEPMDIDDAVVMDNAEKNSMTPKEAMRYILRSNFDADSQECLQTILKIVDNLLSKNEAKFRSLRINNKAFEKKILSKKGGLESLFSLGFEYDVVNNVGFDFDNSKNIQKTPDLIILRPENEDRGVLMDARGEISEILMTTLKAEAIPSLPNIQPLPDRDLNMRLNVNTFDPFKSQSFNTQAAAVGAPNPSSVAPDGGKSSTERKLEILQQKQKRLEESVQKLTDREISAFLPGEIGPIVSLDNPGDSVLDDKGDAALLASVAKKKMEERKKQDEGGFTTKSMREIEKMKKAKVYSYAQLKIYFPDGARVEAKFLPSESIADVKAILTSIFVPEFSPVFQFDLYVTPPRRILIDTKSINDEGLVPAAKVHVSWHVGPAKGAPPGSYLQNHLFQYKPLSHETRSFPISIPLSDPSKDVASDKSTKEEELMQKMLGKRTGFGFNKSKKTNSNEEETKGGIRKPKWFKS
mmetsp:Transcript_9374/g.17637  ORF Transcript_9374/g.17637 Transcript_9374/m.17637 type:complete len:589 (+) Transcript_9374:129-1895(+)